MRYLLISTFILGYTMAVFGQNASPVVKAQLQPASQVEWELSKYVWSHTHPGMAKGEKPLLDFDVIDKWREVGDDRDVAVSLDGKYVSYCIVQRTYKFKTLVIQSMSDSWKQEFLLDRSGSGFFSADSKQYVFSSKDTLSFLCLGESKPTTIIGVASFKKPLNLKNEWLAWQEKSNTHTVVLKSLLTGKEDRFDDATAYNFNGSSEWLVVQLGNEAKDLMLFNLQTGLRQRYSSVAGYVFAQNGKALLLKTTTQKNNENITALQYVNLETEKVTRIWPMGNKEGAVTSYSINGDGKQIVFVIQEAESQKELRTGEGQGDKVLQHSVWYWQEEMDKPLMRTNEEIADVDGGLFIQGASFFFNGSHIVLTLQQWGDSLRPKPDAVQLDVWSYKDTVMQSMQPDQLKKLRTYRAIINTKGKIIASENKYFKIKASNKDFVVLGKIGKEINGDRFWEPGYNIDSNWLVSLKDGSRKFLATELSGVCFVRFSPGGRYLVYFDAKNGCSYFSIDLRTRKLANISAGIPTWKLGIENRYKRPHEKPSYWVGIAGWLQGDKGLLVYDNYDIWELDLSGQKQPVNVTNDYGRSHGIMFYLRGYGPDRENISFPPVFSEHEVLLLQTFNVKNKQNGVFQKVLGRSGDPKQLFMGPCRLDILGAAGCPDELHLGSAFMKDSLPYFMVKRQSAIDAPNYFYTSDFKAYRPITNFHQQQQYNWLTAELHSFKQLDGTISQGILYKPQNFDPAKKYPVIISFYASLTDQLYQFPTPGYLDCPGIFDNPAWFVSHGYLVFLPDIYFMKGQYGPSTVNTMEGAVRYLSALPFVDSKRMGASGHSNSGRFGYYLFTHSHLFAAMSLGSGFGGTDVLSIALSLGNDGKSGNLEWGEKGALGAALGNIWQNKRTWIDHIAVLQANKATSPLLLFHNQKDADDIRLAIELFNALWRLNKKVWWLNYNNGDHVLKLLNDRKDYTIRYTQFFDHYLKGAPAPRWMTEGVPYKLKGIESRYELDPNGSCGVDCPICRKYNAENK